MAKYQDNEKGNVFQMDERAFQKFLAGKKMSNGLPRYSPHTGQKKRLSKAELPKPELTKAEKVAEVLDNHLSEMTAKQLVEEIKSMQDVEQLQALAQDSRKTVARAAQSRLAEDAGGNQ